MTLNEIASDSNAFSDFSITHPVECLTKLIAGATQWSQQRKVKHLFKILKLKHWVKFTYCCATGMGFFRHQFTGSTLTRGEGVD